MADLIRHLLLVMLCNRLVIITSRRWRIKSAMTFLLYFSGMLSAFYGLFTASTSASEHQVAFYYGDVFHNYWLPLHSVQTRYNASLHWAKRLRLSYSSYYKKPSSYIIGMTMALLILSVEVVVTSICFLSSRTLRRGRSRRCGGGSMRGGNLHCSPAGAGGWRG